MDLFLLLSPNEQKKAKQGQQCCSHWSHVHNNKLKTKHPQKNVFSFSLSFAETVLFFVLHAHRTDVLFFTILI